MMQIGDYVTRLPVTVNCGDDYSLAKKPLPGRVVYIHPKGLFAVLEFDGVFGNPRESFPLAELTENNLVRERKR